MSTNVAPQCYLLKRGKIVGISPTNRPIALLVEWSGLSLQSFPFSSGRAYPYNLSPFHQPSFLFFVRGCILLLAASQCPLFSVWTLLPMIIVASFYTGTEGHHQSHKEPCSAVIRVQSAPCTTRTINWVTSHDEKATLLHQLSDFYIRNSHFHCAFPDFQMPVGINLHF